MSNNTESPEFDLVIFGATGFTGFFVVRELVLSIEENPSEYSQLKWAVAGRSLAKLDDVLQKVGLELGKNLVNVPKIEADIKEPSSLTLMAAKTKLIINTVGPYRFFGRPMVDACVQARTDHIDISGEPQYIETMQLEYSKKAEDNGTLIISTCGWDSIPCDLGVDFLKRKFDGKLHSVETFMAIKPGSEV